MTNTFGNRTYARSWGTDEVATDYGTKRKSRRSRRHAEKAQFRRDLAARNF